MIKVGVQGDVGSFSEKAGHTFAERKGLKEYEIVYLVSSQNVMKAIEAGDVDFGVTAIENSQGGVVLETIHAMAAHRFAIHDLFQIMVIQNLLVKPGTKMTDIKSIHSHQQALRQCRNFLAEHLWGTELVEADDTALSAKRLSEGQLDPGAAVIANAACAELYGLEILQANIQDLKNNLTMFIAGHKIDE